MADTTQVENWDNPDKTKLPGNLNVLTILTYIGSGIGLIMIPLSKMLLGFFIKMMEKPEVMEQMNEKKLAEFEKTKSLYEMMSSNMVAYVVPAVIGIALCIYGAIQMRKLKKQGFYMYVIGEILPILSGAIVLGFSNQFSSPWSYIFGLGIPALFIFLYSRNLKYMS